MSSTMICHFLFFSFKYHNTEDISRFCITNFYRKYLILLAAVLDEMNREKQLWEKLNPRKPIILPPIYQESGTVLMPRVWDIDTRTEVPSTITDTEWEELKYCHYLRPPVKRP